MIRCIHAGGRLLFLFAVSALAAAALVPLARAEVFLSGQLRDIMTFATLQVEEGSPALFESGNESSPGYGPFSQTVESFVSDPVAGWSHSWATQTSTLGPEGLTAEGSFMGEASLSGAAPFGEAFGSSRSFFDFFVDEPTPWALVGDVEAAGNGRLTLNFQQPGVTGILYTSFQNDQVSFAESGVLDPGSYQFQILTLGYGQAIASSGVTPASGSYSITLRLGSATAVPAADAAPEPATLAVRPNPVRGETRILARGDVGIPAGAEFTVFDAAGRRVRSLGELRGASLTWDARDENGRRVSPGVYFVGAPYVQPARVIVTP